MAARMQAVYAALKTFFAADFPCWTDYLRQADKPNA